MRTNKKYDLVIFPLTILSMILIFIWDLNTPLGKIVWIFYSIPICIVCGISTFWAVINTLIVTMLVAMGFFKICQDPNWIPTQTAIFNRGTGICLIWLLTFFNIFLRKKTADLHAAWSSFHDLINMSPEGIIVLDQEGRVIFVNSAIDYISGRKAQEFMGEMLGVPIIGKSGTEVNIVSKGGQPRTAEMVAVESTWHGKKSYLMYLRDITDRKKLEETLRELSDRKSAFVALVSHELKSPLSIVRDLIALVIDGLAGEVSGEQKNILEKGTKNIARLLRLTDNLLDLSKIEAGKMTLKRELLDIGPLVEGIIDEYKTALTKKELALTKNIPQDIGALWADGDKLTQVIINLLSNAIKYTPNKRNVTVSVEGNEKEVRFIIADTGDGISKDGLVKLFDKFERLTAEKQEGTGLGLSIAKDIVELHQGKIWVESEIGKGSKFIFMMPRDLRGSRVKTLAASDGSTWLK